MIEIIINCFLGFCAGSGLALAILNAKELKAALKREEIYTKQLFNANTSILDLYKMQENILNLTKKNISDINTILSLIENLQKEIT